MKNIAALLLISLSCVVAAHAADVIPPSLISFSKDGGGRVVITISSDINIPITTSGYQDFVVFNLENVYSTPQIYTATTPVTQMSDPGSITASVYLAGSGTSVPSLGYNNWGALDGPFGEIDSTDFYGVFAINETLNAGDVFTIKAGSMTMAPGILMPDFAPTTLILTEEFGIPLSPLIAIPEPSSLALGTLAGLGLLTRRRRTA